MGRCFIHIEKSAERALEADGAKDCAVFELVDNI